MQEIRDGYGEAPRLLPTMTEPESPAAELEMMRRLGVVGIPAERER